MDKISVADQRLALVVAQGVFEVESGPVFAVDREYRYLMFNTAHAQVMKKVFRAEIELGGCLLDYMSVSRDRDIAKANLDRALAGQMVEDRAWTGEEGRRRFFVVTHSPIWDGDELVAAAVRAVDETDRELAIEAEERLVQIIDATPDVVSSASPDGVVTYLNRGGRAALGLEQDQDLNGVRVGEVHPEWSRKLVLEEGIPTAIREGVWTGETSLLTTDGREIPVSQVIVAHKNDHGIVEYLSTIMRDISERKRAEDEILRLNAELEDRVRARTADLEAKNVELTRVNRELAEATRAKSDFLAHMSHELRTPLNSILGFSGILLQELPGELNGEQRKQLEMIRASGQHLLALVNQVLDLTRIEGGGMAVEFADLDPGDLAMKVAAVMRPAAQGKGLALECEVAQGCPSIRSDALRVEQILLNLVGNAVKYTSDGGVTITVRPEPGAMAFEVSDTGPGIDQDSMRRIFQDFYQAGLARRRAQRSWPWSAGVPRPCRCLGR